jgi:hypothetical protein
LELLSGAVVPLTPCVNWDPQVTDIQMNLALGEAAGDGADFRPGYEF